MFRPIEQGGVRTGTIFVVSDLRDIATRLKRYVVIVGVMFLTSLLVALVLSSRLQRLVSDPILRLAKVTRSVAVEKNYSVRAVKQTNDELGQLVDGFNEMLSQIQQRDAALQSAREGLEARVVERTTELAKSNQDLQSEISERKRIAEKLLVQSTALDAAANAIVITDHTGTIEWVNRAFTTLTGYTSEEAVGQNPSILKSDKQDAAFYRNLWQTISSGKVWSGELTNRRKNGSLYEEEMTITPLRNAEGVIIRYIAVKGDITERKLAEAQRERLAALVEGSPDFIGFADPKTMQIQFINKHGRKMCGIGEDEDVGKLKLGDLHPAWMNKRLTEVIMPAVVRDGLWEGEGAFLQRSGREVPVSMALLALKNASGEIDIFYTISRDITERNRGGRARDVAPGTVGIFPPGRDGGNSHQRAP